MRLKSGFDIAELLATQGVTWLPTAVHTVSKLSSAGRAMAQEALGLRELAEHASEIFNLVKG